MKKIIKNIIISPLQSIRGNIYFQPFFKRLHLFSLKAMNYGGGANPNTSGERFVLEYIKNKLASFTPLTIFDVGANTGSYSTMLLTTFSPNQINVHAFEPSTKAFTDLQANLGQTSIRLWNLGINECEGEMILYSDSEGSGLASVFHRRLDHFSVTMNEQESIKLTTIDTFCSKHGVKHIHLLKLDIEGNELPALRGAKGLIATHNIDYIQFEFGGCNIDSKTFFQDFYYLLSPHFKIYRIVKNGLVPILSYRESQEIFITTNYLAERITI